MASPLGASRAGRIRRAMVAVVTGPARLRGGPAPSCTSEGLRPRHADRLRRVVVVAASKCSVGVRVAPGGLVPLRRVAEPGHRWFKCPREGAEGACRAAIRGAPIAATNGDTTNGFGTTDAADESVDKEAEQSTNRPRPREEDCARQGRPGCEEGNPREEDRRCREADCPGQARPRPE